MNETTIKQLLKVLDAQQRVMDAMQQQIRTLAEHSLQQGKNLTELVEYLNKEKDMSIVFNQN